MIQCNCGMFINTPAAHPGHNPDFTPPVSFDGARKPAPTFNGKTLEEVIAETNAAEAEPVKPAVVPTRKTATRKTVRKAKA